jgi:type IV pilus assembly protein PilA
VAIIGILAALAIPDFIKFQARSKQSEAKTNLKALFTGQKAKFGERDRYATNPGEIGFSPERGNRYYYDLGLDTGGACGAALISRAGATETQAATSCGFGADELRYGSALFAYGTLDTNVKSPGVITHVSAVTGNPVVMARGFITMDCPGCDFEAAAVGNVDNDAAADAFIISSQFTQQTATACAELIAATMPDAPGTAVNYSNDVSCD